MLPRKAPVPVHAKVNQITGLVTVRFDQFLRSGTSHWNNWSGRTYSAPFDYPFARAQDHATVQGSAVTFTPQLGAMEGGPLTVSYTPPPRDVVGQCSLVPVAPFVDYPMAGPTSFPQFVIGGYEPLTQRWSITFSEDITVEPAVFDPRVWRLKSGFITKLATAVNLVGGTVELIGPPFNGSEDRIIYQGGPPDWTDAEGDPIQAFTHALPS